MEFPWLPAPSRFLASFPLIGSVPTVATAGVGPERPSDYSFHVPQPKQQMATSGRKAKPLKGDKLASLAPVQTAPCTRGRERQRFPTRSIRRDREGGKNGRAGKKDREAPAPSAIGRKGEAQPGWKKPLQPRAL